MKTNSSETLIQQGLGFFSIVHSPSTVEKLSIYMQELDRWNRRVNLTAKRPVEWVIRELLYDAFFLSSVIKDVRVAVDIGSGNGILALTLAIIDETMQMFSVDKSLRKIQFQRHIKRSLKLPNLSLIQGRIESLEPLCVDALLSKGFGSSSLILKTGGKHLNEGGAAYLLKGLTERAGAFPGFHLETARHYRLPENPKEYQLFVYRKMAGGSN
ncbi:MAG TPA: RsmG family class I SAM-dependent methyltransferase [Syntrophorhabdales bacterium]|nr:RsmG family class I SAM-dependent methyltransferase [Syntrophorhabdales bacterium]